MGNGFFGGREYRYFLDKNTAIILITTLSFQSSFANPNFVDFIDEIISSIWKKKFTPSTEINIRIIFYFIEYEKAFKNVR